MYNQELSKRVSLGANLTEDFHPNQLMSFATTLSVGGSTLFPPFNRQSIGVESGVRYIAKSTISAAPFSYRWATQLSKRVVIVR